MHFHRTITCYTIHCIMESYNFQNSDRVVSVRDVNGQCTVAFKLNDKQMELSPEKFMIFTPSRYVYIYIYQHHIHKNKL